MITARQRNAMDIKNNNNYWVIWREKDNIQKEKTMHENPPCTAGNGQAVEKSWKTQNWIMGGKSFRPGRGKISSWVSSKDEY